MVHHPSLYVARVFGELFHFAGHNVQAEGIKYLGISLVQTDKYFVGEVLHLIKDLSTDLRKISKTFQVAAVGIHTIETKIFIPSGIFQEKYPGGVLPEIIGNIAVGFGSQPNRIVLADLLHKNVHPFLIRRHEREILSVGRDLVTRFLRIFKEILHRDLPYLRRFPGPASAHHNR